MTFNNKELIFIKKVMNSYDGSLCDWISEYCFKHDNAKITYFQNEKILCNQIIKKIKKAIDK